MAAGMGDMGGLWDMHQILAHIEEGDLAHPELMQVPRPCRGSSSVHARAGSSGQQRFASWHISCLIAENVS